MCLVKGLGVYVLVFVLVQWFGIFGNEEVIVFLSASVSLALTCYFCGALDWHFVVVFCLFVGLVNFAWYCVVVGFSYLVVALIMLVQLLAIVSVYLFCCRYRLG